MLRKLLITLLPMLLTVFSASAQNYSSLWKKADEASAKDLPQTRIGVLRKIEAKAQRNGDYGQLMKAWMSIASQTVEVSPDSLPALVSRLEQMAATASDGVHKSVCFAVLSHIYKTSRNLSDSSLAISKRYAEKAMADVALLASARTTGYKPFVVEGVNGNIFDHDMLSVIGFETGQYAPMHDYYSAAGNRRAACIVALKMVLHNHRHEIISQQRKSHCMVSLDSLISVYGDLEESGEVAVERYHHMLSCTDVKVEDQIKYINYATQKWPSWQRMNHLRNEYRRLTAPWVKCSSTNGNNSSTALSLRNIEELTVKVYRTTLDGRSRLEPQSEDDYKKMKDGLTLLAGKTQKRVYDPRPDYEEFADTVNVEGLQPGVYMLELATVPQTETLRLRVNVSNLRIMSIALPDNMMRYIVVDAQTGAPVAGAKVELRRHEQEQPLATLTADGCGEAVYACGKQKPTRAFAYAVADKALPETALYGQYYDHETNRKEQKIKIMTDRAVYRPGQTVNVAAVVYDEQLNSNDAKAFITRKAAAGKSVKAELRDANYKIVAEQQLLTDDYGKCHTAFVLPESSLNGRYTVAVGHTRMSISVEAYKRPTFFVEFPEIKEAYSAGDTLVVRGKAVAYNGMPVPGATVRYSVKRCSWWRCFPDEDGAIANNEMATTAIDGTFAVEIPLAVPGNAAGHSRLYHFNVTADVTDASGETQRGQLALPLGTKPVMLSCSLGEQVLADTLKGFSFTLHNAAGAVIDGDVEYEVSTTNSSTRQLVNSSTRQLVNLSTCQLVNSSTKTTNSSTRQLVNLSTKIPTGRYRLTAWAMGDTLKHEFTVFSLSDTIPAAPVDEWFYQSATEFPADGSPVTVQVGSSHPDLHIYYTITSGKKLIESGMAMRSGSLINRKFAYCSDYGSGLTLNYAWVKNGKCHQREMHIRRPKQDTGLKMAWKTFRNKLVPGKQEEWTLCITKSDGTPADAQLSVTMFDKSLDKLRRNSWSRLYDRQPYTSGTNWISPSMDNPLVVSAWQQWKPLNCQLLGFSRFDHTVFPMQYAGRPTNHTAMRLGGMKPVMMKTASATTLQSLDADVAPQQAKIGGLVYAENAADMETADETDCVQPQLRENLTETAFFYPALAADKDGNVSIRFTLPESVTTWRLLGFAHTKDMLNAIVESEAVAAKEVMVQPNMPRFVRLGDRISIPARISNSRTTEAKGVAVMELVDPETGQVVHTQKKRFAVAAQASQSVGFEYVHGNPSLLLVCRISISGKDFSDGEQHYLPVLPDMEMVAESTPFLIKQPGTKVVELPSDAKVTIEYMDNPAWTVVQALPSMVSGDADNAITAATSVYANLIGRHMALANPRLKAMAALWKSETAGGATLQSCLQKNEDLKAMMLDETPWVMEAEQESLQKQRLADFYDDNQMEQRIGSSTNKLAALQFPDGSWGWCKGMAGNAQLTVSVMEMLVRANNIAGKQPATEKMLAKAFQYITALQVEAVRKMRKMENGGKSSSGISNLQIRYLYICSLDGRRFGKEVREANSYLLSLLKKENKSLSIYDKSLSAVIFAKLGDKEKSCEYLESMKQYSVCSESLGRYYDTPKAALSWFDYRLPTQVAAIEALQVAQPSDSATVSEMQQWLLQEKRTQMWDTPINTVNAIYAFMNGNERLLDVQPSAKLYVDGKPLEHPKATAGLGYIKTTVEKSKASTLAIEKSSAGTSWGAVYKQSMRRMADINGLGSDITVRREIIPLDGSPMKVGSRIKVIITIVALRDFDFVQLVDKRAACMEPVQQLSGYSNGFYCSPKDNAVHYFFDRLPKGTGVIETEYYIDRAGNYETGSCTIQCAYAPEFRATAKSEKLIIAE